jgi:hypothetical protein
MIMAVATLLGFGILSIGTQTWNVLDDIILIGALGLWLIPELVWGAYWRPRAHCTDIETSAVCIRIISMILE